MKKIFITLEVVVDYRKNFCAEDADALLAEERSMTSVLRNVNYLSTEDAYSLVADEADDLCVSRQLGSASLCITAQPSFRII